ncbi:DNA repair protein RadA [Alishewanella longhuensis]
MAKTKTAYVCNECGADFMRWQGQCTECGAYSVTEVRLGAVKSKNARFEGYAGAAVAKVMRLNEVDLQEVPRFSSGFTEFDRVLGGGIVPGSAILIGGHPGAGKSTLLLQVMCGLAQHGGALYVTGEESLQQVAMRAQRLGLPMAELKMLAETNVETICQLAQQEKPRIMVIDTHPGDAPGRYSVSTWQCLTGERERRFFNPFCQAVSYCHYYGWSCYERRLVGWP